MLQGEREIKVFVQSSLEGRVVVDLSLSGNLEIGSLWAVGKFSSEDVLVLGVDSSDGHFSGWDSVNQLDLFLDGLSLEFEVEVEVISIKSQDSVESLESEVIQGNSSNQSVEEVLFLGENSLSNGVSSRWARLNSGVVLVVVSEVVSSQSPFELVEFAGSLDVSEKVELLSGKSEITEISMDLEVSSRSKSNPEPVFVIGELDFDFRFQSLFQILDFSLIVPLSLLGGFSLNLPGLESSINVIIIQDGIITKN